MLLVIAAIAAVGSNPSFLTAEIAGKDTDMLEQMFFSSSKQPCNGQTDPFCHSGCDCESFCKGSCAINATKPKNITVYRMTMRHVLGLAAKNTGDLNGDLSFVLGRRTQAFQCRENPTDPQCQGLAQFSGDDPNSTDLVLEMKVEIDGEFGPYLYCNPVNVSDNTGEWKCTIELNFMRTNISDACDANYEGIPDVAWNWRTDPAPKVLLDASPDKCCKVANETGSLFWQHYGNNTCEYGGYPRAQGATRPFKFGIMGLSRKFVGRPCNCSRVFHAVGRENLTVVFGHSTASAQYPMGGTWYSHPAKGECKHGQRVGDGCTWRHVATTAAINASCMYKAIETTVEGLAPHCFDQCPDHKNKTSTCYLKCFSQVTATADRDALRRPWTDSINGGCPRVHLP